ALRLFQWGQVLPLHILDDGQLEGLGIRQVANDDGDYVQLGDLGRAPPPLAGDDLELVGPVGMATDEDGLQDPLRLDRLRQGVHRRLVEVVARLKAPGPQVLDRHGLAGADLVERCVVFAFLAEQGRQAPAEVGSLALVGRWAVSHHIVYLLAAASPGTFAPVIVPAADQVDTSFRTPSRSGRAGRSRAEASPAPGGRKPASRHSAGRRATRACRGTAPPRRGRCGGSSFYRRGPRGG